MRTKQRLNQKLKPTDPAGRRTAAVLSGAAKGNAPSPVRKAQKNDDLAAKMTITPNTPENSKETNYNHQGRLFQTLPTRARPPQPKHKGAQARKRSFTYLETEHHKRKIKPKWLWKLPQWRRLNRALRVSSPRPLKLTPQDTKAQLKQQVEAYVGGSRCSLARSVRSLQLCTSSSESSPSPPPVTPGRTRRATRVYRTPRYLKQLEWNQALHNERKQAQRLDQQGSKMTQSSADSSAVKGTSECLDHMGLTYQREKRKKSLLTARGLPATKKLSRKTSRKLWRRQLDSSSSDSPVSECSANATPLCARSMSSSSPGSLSCPASDTLTSPQDAPSTNIKPAPAKIPSVLKKYANSVSGLKGQKKSEAASCTLADVSFLDITTSLGAFSPTHKTPKSPRTLKKVHFKDSPNPGDSPCASTTQISDKTSKSETTVSRPDQSRLPSSRDVCKCKKSSVKHPESSALTKHKVQVNTCGDFELRRKCQLDMSDLSQKVSRPLQSVSEMIPLPKPVQRKTQRPKNPHQRKKGIKRVCQTASNSPSQTVTRLQAQPQAQFKTVSPERSEKFPAFKATLNTFKWPCSASQENLKTISLTPGDNCARRMRTPFRKPDTPRPKSCPKFLKWKKVLERRARHAATSVSRCQGQSSEKNAELLAVVFGNLTEHSPEQNFNSCDSSIGKSTKNYSHTFRSVLGDENSYNVEQSHSGKGKITARQYSASESVMQSLPSSDSIQAAAQKEMIEWSSSSSSPELTQAIFRSIKFIDCVQLEEAEHASINTTCHPIPSPDSSAFGMDARQQSVSQRTSLSGCMYYIIEPLEPTQPALDQDAFRYLQPGPCRKSQGEGGDHTQPLVQQPLSEQEKNG
ncbi:hypothetical protein MHYP_G00185340 [Metynnis hypsauchen]